MLAHALRLRYQGCHPTALYASIEFPADWRETVKDPETEGLKDEWTVCPCCISLLEGRDVDGSCVDVGNDDGSLCGESGVSIQ